VEVQRGQLFNVKFIEGELFKVQLGIQMDKRLKEYIILGGSYRRGWLYKRKNLFNDFSQLND